MKRMKADQKQKDNLKVPEDNPIQSEVKKIPMKPLSMSSLSKNLLQSKFLSL